MASLPTLSDGIALTHFIVAEDVERSGRFYSDVLGGEIVLAGEPTIVALANSWIIINVGGGPTDDKPSVILEPPQNPDRVSSFLNIRVADIQTTYQTWSERGAHFLTPPIDRGQVAVRVAEVAAGFLIEVGQSNQTDRSAD
jgi:predicted enzyme related to lactoylglutathione lyase